MTAGTLMRIDDMVRNEMKAWDGGTIAARWPEYLKLVAEKTYGCRATERCMNRLEDQNFHSLCAALIQLDRVSSDAPSWYKNDFLMTMNVEVAP